jgi:hypothetical protein
MKNLFLILACLLFYVTGNSQKLEYRYDKAGNRTQCIVIPLKSGSISQEAIEEPIKHDLGPRKIAVFPNPTKGDLRIEIVNGEDDEDYKFHLFDIAGKLIFEAIQHGNGTQQIDLSSHAHGTYILILKAPDAKMDYKIIKN